MQNKHMSMLNVSNSGKVTMKALKMFWNEMQIKMAKKLWLAHKFKLVVWVQNNFRTVIKRKKFTT